MSEPSSDKTLTDLGDVVRHERLTRRITIEDAAGGVVSEKTWTRIEKGRSVRGLSISRVDQVFDLPAGTTAAALFARDVDALRSQLEATRPTDPATGTGAFIEAAARHEDEDDVDLPARIRGDAITPIQQMLTTLPWLRTQELRMLIRNATDTLTNKLLSELDENRQTLGRLDDDDNGQARASTIIMLHNLNICEELASLRLVVPLTSAERALRIQLQEDDSGIDTKTT